MVNILGEVLSTMKLLKEHLRDKVFVISGLLSIENAELAVAAWLTEKAIEVDKKYDEAQHENQIQIITGAKLTIRQLLTELKKDV